MIIVLFHVIYILGKFIYRRYNNNSDDDEDRMMSQEVKLDVAQAKDTKEKINLKRRFSNDDGEEEAKSTIKFNPPAYIQRYQAVLRILTDPRYGGKLKKIVDFGCGELQFCVYLKHMTGVQEALFVDIDKDLLSTYKDRAKPLNADFLHRRSTPLVMRVLEGSITQPDQLLEDTDAVVCIELIEHLYPETLLEVPQNVFGFIRPKVAIFTTPNADFNVLFDRMTGFRHPDHKFEWTRKEFQDWANSILARFPEYEVSFHGICNGPEGTENLGACSQMAVFHRKCDLKTVKVPGIEGLYKPVQVYEYPFEIDNRSDEQKILDDAIYFINKFSMNEDECEEEVPLKKLLIIMSNFYITEDYLKEILENANYTVVARDDGPVVLVPQPSLSGSEWPRSWNEDDFIDNVHDFDEEAGPPIDYYNRNQSLDIDVVDEEDWENELNVVINLKTTNQNNTVNAEEDWEVWDQQYNASSAPLEQQEIENKNADTAIANNSTVSIQPDDMCLEDIVTESRSTELANSTLDSSIEISSFTETKGSDTSDTATIPCQQTQESLISIDKKIAEINSSSSEAIENVTLKHTVDSEPIDESTNSSYKTTSICSMFLEPSKMSQHIHLDSTEQFLDSTMSSPLEAQQCKKLKLDNSVFLRNINESNFEDPKYTSSPHIPSTFVCKKKEDNQMAMSPSSKDEDLSCPKNELKNLTDKSDEDQLQNFTEKGDDKYDDPSTGSNESAIGENNESLRSSQANETPDQLRNYTGTIPKNTSSKLSDTRASTQKDLKLERITPDTPESLLNSWSPEIMDSGYPNSNSPPDLSPVDDLSSIAHDRTLDSESPSVADAPRIGYFDMAENRDLANNNLDDEGNNMEPEVENPHINDIRPLINVLENDLENENDIYVARNNDFPVWLLRLLQRFDADGVGINLPMPQPPNENFGD